MFSSHSELEAALLKCKQCKLCEDGNRGPTSFNGTPDSPFVIVGEGPGGVEDEYGVPLVGPSGQLLDKALWSVAVTRDKIYTSNILKCRPKGNRTPTPKEGSFCANLWLDEELRLIKPQVIVALGSVALHYFGGEDKKITRERGNWFQTTTGIWVIATFHPAYLLRLTGKRLIEAKWQVYYDFKAAVEKCLDLSPGSKLNSESMPDLLNLYTARKSERLKR